MAKKTYVLDTSVYLTDSNCINSFGNNDIVIPLKVLEEIDAKGSFEADDEIGVVFTSIKEAIEDGAMLHGRILKGEARKEFELKRIKIDLKLSELR